MDLSEITENIIVLSPTAKITVQYVEVYSLEDNKIYITTAVITPITIS